MEHVPQTPKSRLREAFLYFAVVLSGLIVDWAAWWLFWRAGADPAIAQALSRALGAVATFPLLRRRVFPGGGDARGQAVRFAASAAATWALSVCLVGLFGLVLPAPAAKLSSDGVTFAAGFLAAKAWVFRRA